MVTTMEFEYFRTMATDWSIVNYYKIPSSLRFTVQWTYGGGWFDRMPATEVKQKATQVAVVRRRSDNSFFDVQVLDEDGVTIRGKHCRGISTYTDICNYFIKKG